jgi:hypothetical protein
MKTYLHFGWSLLRSCLNVYQNEKYVTQKLQKKLKHIFYIQ